MTSLNPNSKEKDKLEHPSAKSANERAREKRLEAFFAARKEAADSAKRNGLNEEILTMLLR